MINSNRNGEENQHVAFVPSENETHEGVTSQTAVPSSNSSSLSQRRYTFHVDGADYVMISEVSSDLHSGT
jgi:hypothetical protein